MRWQVIIVVGIVGAMTFAPHASGQTVRPVRNIKIVDALGKTVGHTVSIESNAGRCANAATVALHIKNTSPDVDDTFLVQVCRDGFVTSTAGQLFYQSGDCSGQPFFIFAAGTGLTNTIFPLAFVDGRGGGSILNVRDPAASAETINVQSVLSSAGSCNAGTPAPLEVVKAVVLMDLAARFPPPYDFR